MYPKLQRYRDIETMLERLISYEKLTNMKIK